MCACIYACVCVCVCVCCSHTGLHLTSEQLDALFSHTIRLKYLNLFKPPSDVNPLLLKDTSLTHSVGRLHRNLMLGESK